MRIWRLVLILSLVSLNSSALEPQNPLSLCERFLEGPDRSKCEERMTKEKPDWYVATICNSNFDDQLFYECVDLAKLGDFSPDKLDDCVGDQYNDKSRMTCIRSALTTPAKAYQSATPASKIKSKNRSKSNKH